MSDEEPRKVKVTVKDKRHTAAEAAQAHEQPLTVEEGEPQVGRAEVAEPDDLAELQR